MGIFDRFKNKAEVKKKKPIKKLDTIAPMRIRESINDWQNALIYAEDEKLPDLNPLLDIYENINLDSHITALIETTFNQVMQTPFNIVSSDKIDPDKTSLFKSQWLHEYIKLVIEARYWGFTGIQLGDIENNKFKTIKRIPRFNIRPHLRGVSKSYTNNTHINYSFDKEPFKTWCVFVDLSDLGLFNKIAKLFIYKRESTTFWAIYNELFGQPYRVGKTDLTDNIRVKNAQNALENMGSSGWSLLSLDDTIEFLASGSGAGYKTHQDFLEWLNKELSKAFLGQTMVLEDGSSRSQAEVHESQMESFIESIRTWLEFHVNDELIPRMIKLGFPLNDNDKFVFDAKRDLSKKEWADIILILSNAGFSADEKTISDKIGLELEKSNQIPVGTMQNSNSVIDKVHAIYKDSLK